jgi:hypothetical protein
MEERAASMAKVINDFSTFIRGADFCRACHSDQMFSALNLGALPIANELRPAPLKNYESFELHLRICSDCGLGQVADVVSSNRLFTDYRYLSSASKSFVEHAANFANGVIDELSLGKSDYVLEIASNDGYLLSHFIQSGIKVLGVEPAQNVAAISSLQGIPTIADFFGAKLAQDIVSQHGYPRLIVANNVLAHVPDIRDFMYGISILSNSETLISIENPRLRNIIEFNQFDTIYHEHFSYLSCKAVLKLAQEFGLVLFDVENLETHGGSNRYWLKKKNVRNTSKSSVEAEMRRDEALNLFQVSSWERQDFIVQSYLKEFREFLFEKSAEGKSIFGYGAAAKASTLLNAAKVKSGDLVAIADASLEKQERFMPNMNLPIIKPEILNSLNPEILILFVWNITSEIMKWVETSGLSGIEVWVTIPELKRIY